MADWRIVLCFLAPRCEVKVVHRIRVFRSKLWTYQLFIYFFINTLDFGCKNETHKLEWSKFYCSPISPTDGKKIHTAIELWVFQFLLIPIVFVIFNHKHSIFNPITHVNYHPLWSRSQKWRKSTSTVWCCLTLSLHWTPLLNFGNTKQSFSIKSQQCHRYQ